MKKIIVFVCTFLFVATLALAAGPKSYQVTGPIIEIKGDVIVVQKDTEKWEIAKDNSTKIKGDLKVGDKVTIKYTMKAVEIESKAAPSKAPVKKK